MNKLVESILNELRLQIFTEQDNDDKTIIAIYPGRFQPMGRHHKAAYDWLASQFGEKNTFVVTSDKTEPDRSPFNFKEKKKIINKHGIKNVVQIKNPYRPTELLEKYDPDKTVIIYMIGEKDAGRLRGYKRLMKYNKTTAIPYKDIDNPYAYYVYAPHVSYNIPSFGEMSGTNIRKALGDREAKLSELKSRFKSIMGWFDVDVFNMVMEKMNSNRGDLKEDYNDWFRFLSNMTQEQGQLFFTILKKEYGDTKDLLPIIQKFMTTKTLTPEEKKLFGSQMKDLLKLTGLGAIAAIPIPGTMLLIPVVVNLAKKFKINLLPEGFNNESEELPIVRREFWSEVFEGALKEDDFVICEECGEKMKQIQYRHLKYKHNMTLNEYVIKHPNSKLVSESAKNYGDKNPMNIPGVREKQIDSLNKPELKKLFAEKSRNRVVKEETRIKCSLNNSMNDPNNRKKVSKRLKETYAENLELIEKRRKKFTEVRNSDEYKQRMVELGYWRKESEIPLYEKYVSKVRELTEDTYKKYFYEIPNAKMRSRQYHLDHKISISFGFKNNLPPEIISHHCNLEVIHHSLNESKFVKNSITPIQLYELINNSSNKIDTRQLLVCGGAAGHMQHPFDDMGLTFGDLKEMFKIGLSGKITTVGAPTEKLDGQNLFVTFKKGKLYAARNKGDIKTGGMDYKSIASKFAGRGEIEEAFTFAFRDLQSAVQKLTEKQQLMIFKNGSVWMNLEVMYPKSSNVINYDGAYIVFHGSAAYNVEGEKTKDYPKYADMLAGMIKQVNANTQKTFSIEKPKALTVGKSKGYREKIQSLTSELTALQNQMGCKDDDTLAVWHQRWWEKFITDELENKGLRIEPDSFKGLVKRWAFYDKTFPLNSRTLPGAGLLEWAKDVEKTTLKDQLKKNIRPFEDIILKFGAEVLKNVSDVMSLNPDAATQQIKSDVKNAINTLSTSNDIKDLEVLKTQLSRIEAAGGIDAIVPLEGIVFNFKGKTYKLTGTFAPVNQLLGYLKFK